MIAAVTPANMGCTVDDDIDGLAVTHDPARPLTGIDVDMADVSDLVPTLAAVAATATTPTTITGVGFIRAKESDRLGDLAPSCGRSAPMSGDRRRAAHRAGRALRGGDLGTHHDHRLAMAFGVLARRGSGGSAWSIPTSCRRAGPGTGRSARPSCTHDTMGRRAGARIPPVVAAFDVDGTLTTRDCVVPFLAAGRRPGRLAVGLGRQRRTHSSRRWPGATATR